MKGDARVKEWSPVWESNTDAAEIAGTLRFAKRVVCLTHAKPDGDAAGSSLGVARALRLAGVDAQICYVGPVPRWLKELAGETAFSVATPATAATPPGPEPDAIVITDTGSWTQLSEFKEWLTPRRDRTVVMDHHLHGDGEAARLRLIRTTDAAAAQVVAPVCAKVLGVETRELPREVAEPLYLGLATDTQWFRLSNVTPATLRLAADLMEAGVDHTRLYEIIEQRDTASRWRLMGRALSSLELHAGGSVALMRLSLRDFDECGADRNDTGGFADMVQHIESVRVAIVLTEAEAAPGAAQPGGVKVSMRSKPGPDAVDVNALTRTLGGGGHARAAGAKMPGVSMDDARARILGMFA